METYRLHHPKSPELPWSDPNQGHATRKMEFTVANDFAVVISAWAWDAGTCKWTPCFENKKIPNPQWDPQWLYFNHSIALERETARDIWNLYRKEGWV